jgi:hypothetical protein
LFIVVSNILLIFIYIFIIYNIIVNKFNREIVYILLISTVIQIFDKPFYIQITMADIIGISFFFFRYSNYKHFIKNKNIFYFSIVLFVPILIGFINSISPFEYTSFNISKRFIVYLYAVLRFFGIFGSMLFITYNYFYNIINLENIKKVIIFSILISSVSAYIVFLNFSSPYFYFKGASYTPDSADLLFQNRLSGFCYEPRLLGYYSALNFFLLDSITLTKINKFIFKVFSIITLALTISMSGITFFLFLLSIYYLISIKFINLLKSILVSSFILIIIYLNFNDFVNSFFTQFMFNFEKRVFIDNNPRHFKYFPDLFTHFELHDLPVLNYFDQNITHLFYGFGYGLGRIFMAPYSWIADITGESLGIIGTSTCCEPMVGIVYFLSIGGVFFLLLWLIYYIINLVNFKKKKNKLAIINYNFIYIIFASTIFLLFQIPQSSIIILYYFIVFIFFNLPNKYNDKTVLHKF